ncbi:hypothetical protein NDU88_006737 [Pleurodeles waltl]|uniref:Uncharacterized protein n=1 Tax=Pleurodeles waltl TaxID=8319 RepID=A0AAV7VNH2_PLEWA|nr:hypothetical protein NDU88_006737 [Pleurodeles waltl]
MFPYVLLCVDKAFLGLWFFIRCCQQYRHKGPSPARSAHLPLHGGTIAAIHWGVSPRVGIFTRGSPDDSPRGPRHGRPPHNRPRSHPPLRRRQGQTGSREAAPGGSQRPCLLQTVPTRPPSTGESRKATARVALHLWRPRTGHTRFVGPIQPLLAARTIVGGTWKAPGQRQPALTSQSRSAAQAPAAPALVVSISYGRRYFPTMFAGSLHA